eukprot:s3333_g15.t1
MRLPRHAAASRLRGFPGTLRPRGFAASAASRLARDAAASRLRGFRGFSGALRLRGFAASAASPGRCGLAALQLPRLRGFAGALRLRGFVAFVASAASPEFGGFAASRLRGFFPLAGPRLPLHCNATIGEGKYVNTFVSGLFHSPVPDLDRNMVLLIGTPMVPDGGLLSSQSTKKPSTYSGTTK